MRLACMFTNIKIQIEFPIFMVIQSLSIPIGPGVLVPFQVRAYLLNTSLTFRPDSHWTFVG